ncbi:MAG: hypothetical protein DRJ52_10455 [Thermoprotei archaeon]|nr:MAG: hypothetical protein DRJ52_10455 [Thermoprotei archaeon]
MKICPKCTYVNPPEALFCIQCRENLCLNPITYISAEEFQHELDKTAVKTIESFGPLASATKWAVDRYMDIHRAELLGSAIRVSPREFPVIYGIASECAKTLSLRKLPEIYIVNNPTWNAYTVGSENEPAIIIHSPLVDNLSREELKAIIGHEIGHVKCNHHPYLTLVFLLAEIPGYLNSLLKLVTIPMLAALYKWSRAAELTADRASLLCTRDLDVLKSAFVKLALGSSKAFERINLEEFLKQQDELEELIRKNILAKIALAFKTHPLTTVRVKELENYYRSQDYWNLVNKVSASGFYGRMIVFFLNTIYQGGLPFRQGAWAVEKRFISGDFTSAELVLSITSVDDPWFERHVTVEFNGYKIVDDRPISPKTGLYASVNVSSLVQRNNWNTLRVHVDCASFRWKISAYLKLS